MIQPSDTLYVSVQLTGLKDGVEGQRPAFSIVMYYNSLILPLNGWKNITLLHEDIEKRQEKKRCRITERNQSGECNDAQINSGYVSG